MITKEAIEAAALSDAAFDGRRFDGLSAADKRRYRERSAAAITAAFAAMPGPAVKAKPLDYIVKSAVHNGLIDSPRLESDLQSDFDLAVDTISACVMDALTPAPDLASENERLRAALEAAEAEFNTISCEGVTEIRSLHDAFDRAKMFADRGATNARAALERT